MAKLAEIKLLKLGVDGSESLTLVPRGVNPTNGVASLSEANSVPAVEKRVTISVSQPSRNRKNFKVQVKIQNPTTCEKVGVCDPSVSRSAYSDVTFSFTQFSTAKERAFVRTELMALLADPLMVDAIDNLNPAY